MEGYFVSVGFFGYVNGKKMLFASESDYYDYLREDADDDEQ